MLREHRSRAKLEAYYKKFVENGVLDANVHPWVAQSWQESRRLAVRKDRMNMEDRLSKTALSALQERHRAAIDCLARLAEPIRAFFQENNLSLLLIDADCRVLKSYSLPYFQRTPGEIEGVRVGVENVGTSSISIAREHLAPFWLFGPEMWVEECQCGDACSVPVSLAGACQYIVTLVSVRDPELPPERAPDPAPDAIISILLTLKRALEGHLADAMRIKAEEAILDATPFAVYHVLQGGAVAYANKLGHTRLAGIGAEKEGRPDLSEVILNYAHTPIRKGFDGVPSYNQEVTWITPTKTYEDITTVVPLGREAESGVPESVVVVSMPIEDLRTLVAHAAGYTAKYSLASMVGEGAAFAAVRDKAARVARTARHVLLQGEAGTGKQRMAHGIHQASARAAGPLISLRCSDTTQEILEQELFGILRAPDASHPGRLELASGGTLFLDEIEKMPKTVADALAGALRTHKSRRLGEEVERGIDVRIIAACDSDLRRLTERGLFSRALYDIVARGIVRLPPLRSRREDIPHLAAHIVAELAEQHQMPPKQILPATEEKLMGYDWPGNIKQLQSVLEYAFFRAQGDRIAPDDVSLMGDVRPDNSWKEDRDVFVKAWQAAGGNVSRLANLLGVSRVTLYRYLKKYNLEKK